MIKYTIVTPYCTTKDNYFINYGTYLSTPLVSFLICEWKARYLIGGSHVAKYVSSKGWKDI